MYSIYKLKPQFQAILRPVCKQLAKAGVTANQVTISALVLSALAGASIALQPDADWPLLSLPLVLVLRMALNAIDGMLAREYHMASRLGAVLNEMGDVISDAVLYLPLAFVPGVPIWGVYAVVLLGTMSEMIGVVAVQISGQRRYDGPFGKSDRAFAFGALAVLIGGGVPVQPWIAWFLGFAVVLSIWTVLNRGAKALEEEGRAC
jgi:CDP-diacylglycerol--glycerol-3-phosphate 3-phosphatidyltransferase